MCAEPEERFTAIQAEGQIGGSLGRIRRSIATHPASFALNRLDARAPDKCRRLPLYVVVTFTTYT